MPFVGVRLVSEAFCFSFKNWMSMKTPASAASLFLGAEYRTSSGENFWKLARRQSRHTLSGSPHGGLRENWKVLESFLRVTVKGFCGLGIFSSIGKTREIISAR